MTCLTITPAAAAEAIREQVDLIVTHHPLPFKPLKRLTADQPAGFQKRVFPFRVEGVRGYDLSMTNMSVARTFRLGGARSFQFRLDMQNLFNRQHYADPNLNPTSTNFGQVHAVNNTVMRFFTFNMTYRF